MKLVKAALLSALLVAGTAGFALAQDRIVSDVPYEGFLKGVSIPMNGARYLDEAVSEAPSKVWTVERGSIRGRDLTPTEFAEAFDRLISG